MHPAGDPSPGGGGGGDGNVTAFKDGGGRLLKQARIVLIYWGSAWADPATTPSQQDFTAALQRLVSGPWGTLLAQYRGIGPMQIEKIDRITTGDPPAKFTNTDIRNAIDARIKLGTVPTPSSTTDRIYCVLMPTGHSSGDTPYVGEHQDWDRNGTHVYYAWVTNDGTLTGADSIPKVCSHEIAEAVTDPDVSSGIIVNGTDEIGDVCNSTYSTVDGAAQEAYWSQADRRCVLPVSSDLPAASGTPSLVQSRFGKAGNFEVLVSGQRGLMHVWRDDDNPFLPWSKAASFAPSRSYEAASMIQSNYGSPGNLEVIARSGSDLYACYRDSGPKLTWSTPQPIKPGTAVAGNPVLIQSRFGTKGNFEVVVPAAGNGILHVTRYNDDPGFPWGSVTTFATSLGHVDAVAMIQSTYGKPGNLEVVARVGTALYHAYRDDKMTWSRPLPIKPGAAVAGNPVLIQSRFGKSGNFEVVAPAAAGGLLHLSRYNDDPGFPWGDVTAFGASAGHVDAVAMIQSHYGNPGNLEVIARTGTGLLHFYRDSGPSMTWWGPKPVRATVW